MSKLIRASAKNDKQIFLHEELTNGNWNAVKKLRRGPTKKYVNMRNLQNEIVDTSVRPDTMATYFASVHWKSHLAHLVPDGTMLIQDGIPVSESEFCELELLRVLKKLKKGKACGNDDIPPDFWKTLSADNTAVKELLKLCNHCWRAGDIPEIWRIAKVVLLFKKGDNSLPENDRPISLLPIGYKVLASLIRQRLLDGGVD